MEDMKILNLENEIIESMIDTAINNIVVRKVKEGILFMEHDSINVLDNDNNKHFVTYCPYDFKGENLNKNTRNKINKAFINKYTYKDIINKFDDMQQEKINKLNQAENTKHILESLINELSNIKKYGTIELKANNNLIKYYIEFKRNYSVNLEIYLSDKEDLFDIRYNYSWSTMDKRGLDNIINDIIVASEEELREERKQQEQEQKERDIYNKRLELAKQICSGKTAIIKLKSGYQCLENGLRYSVGTGKSGKFYKLNGITAIVEYLEKKDINKYVFIDEEKTSNLTNEKLKAMKYENIA